MSKIEEIFDKYPSIRFIFSNWAVCLSFIVAIGTLLGYILFSVSPFYTIQEIAYKQQQDNLKREFVQFHNNLGTKFLYVEQFDAARDEFNQVLKVDPLNQNAAKGLFECDVFSEANNESYDPEITDLKLNGLKEKYPNDPLPYLYLGDFAYYNDQIDNASYYYNKTISLDKSVAAAYFGMGMIYDREQKPADSLKMYSEAVNCSNWNIKYRDSLATTYYDLKEYQNAINWFNNETLILVPGYLDSYVGYSNSYRCLGDLDNASEIQEEQIKLMEDNNTENISINQNYFYYLGNSGDTIYLYEYETKKFYFYYDLALTYYLIGNETKTLEYVKKADDLHIGTYNETLVKDVLDYDIKNLQEAQPQFTNKTIEFKNKYE